MSLATFQAGLKDILVSAAAVTAGPGVSDEQLAIAAQLAGLEIMLELDEDATAEQLAAQDAVFEREISRKGFLLVISTPRAEAISRAKLPGGVHLRLLCQVAFIESPAVNRAAVDPDHPELTPANKRPLTLIRAALQAFLAAGIEVPDQMITNPEQDLEGLNLHGLLVTGKDDVRAAS